MLIASFDGGWWWIRNGFLKCQDRLKAIHSRIGNLYRYQHIVIIIIISPKTEKKEKKEKKKK